MGLFYHEDRSIAQRLCAISSTRALSVGGSPQNVCGTSILRPLAWDLERIPFGIAYRSECYRVPRVPRGITKRRPITVTALLDAAMELFAEQGYGSTSIPDICTRAGLTKGAFYSNFANKDALFLALLDRSWAAARRVDPPGHAGRRRTGGHGVRGSGTAGGPRRRPAMDARVHGVLPARDPSSGGGEAPGRSRAARAIRACRPRDRGTRAGGTAPDASGG